MQSFFHQPIYFKFEFCITSYLAVPVCNSPPLMCALLVFFSYFSLLDLHVCEKCGWIYIVKYIFSDLTSDSERCKNLWCCCSCYSWWSTDSKRGRRKGQAAHTLLLLSRLCTGPSLQSNFSIIVVCQGYLGVLLQGKVENGVILPILVAFNLIHYKCTANLCPLLI